MEYSMLSKFKEAKKYQFLAIKALLPECASEHLDNIEKELTEIFKGCEQETQTEKKVKKVHIV